MNWSGGKDSSFALWKYGTSKVDALLTSISSDTGRVSMHGVRQDLLQRQAEAMGKELKRLHLPTMPDMNTYETAMQSQLKQLVKEGYSEGLFGDIFLEDLRRYREKQYAHAGLSCVFPIWHYDTRDLISEFVSAGFKAILVAVDNDKLGSEWAGREIDENFLSALPSEVDPCGENGEYHTFVYDGPVFRCRVRFEPGEKVQRSYPDPSNEGHSKQFTFIDIY